MKVRDAMSPSVVTVRPDASILEASELMLKHDIGGLPVVDRRGRLVGIVTERDFLRPAHRGTGYRRPRWLQVLIGEAKVSEDHEQATNRKVAEVMTENPITVGDETPLEEVVSLMDRHDFSRLPVLRDGKLVGIVARADLLRALVRSLRKTSAVSKQDEDLRASMTELERQSWLHRTRS
jgi:CBS domain-containing protein